MSLLLYAKGGGGRVYEEDSSRLQLTRPGLYLYLPILQDLSTKYLLNASGSGPPDPYL
jgi:hypothetical protein